MQAAIPQHHLHPVVVLERYQEPPRPVLKAKRKRTKVNLQVPAKSFVEVKSQVWKDHHPDYSDATISIIVKQLWENLDVEEKKMYIGND